MPATSTKFVARAGTQLDLFSSQLQNSHTGQRAPTPSSTVSGAPAPRQPRHQRTQPAGASAAGSRRVARALAVGKLGTFDGVFVPVCLSIWGVLAFLRFPWIIGQAGLLGSLLLFTLGYFLTSTTTLSLSAISTNGTVKGGGAYFLISRVLGPEFGGSIGVVFWIGTVLTGVLNLLGFVEPLLGAFGQTSGMIAPVLADGPWWELLYASCAALVCLALCMVGSSVVARASIFLAAILLISTTSVLFSLALQPPFEKPDLFVVFDGFNMDTLRSNLWPQFTMDLGAQQSFRTVFSIVFPACTGILAGASMSGDLRAPSRSIPRGTIAALVFTYAAYSLLALLIAGSIERETLLKNVNVLQDVALLPPLVGVGIASTSFFSALGSLLGAARLFECLIADELLMIPASLQRVLSNAKYAQFWGVVVSYLLMQIILVAVGDMNDIAPFVTMCSLLTFGVLNLACLLLRASGSPNFRPTFEFFSWRTALSGFVGCMSAMFIVDDLHALYSCVFAALLFVSIHYAAPPKTWGDISQSLVYHQVRKYLLRLDSRREHVKFWRPQVLVLVRDPRRDFALVQFLNDLKKGGLFVLSTILKGDDFGSRLADYKRQMPAWLRYVDIAKIKAFVQITIAPTERIGAQNLLLGSGLGGMKPNILAMGFLEDDRRRSGSSIDFDDQGGSFSTMRQRVNPNPNASGQIAELDSDPLAADLPNSVDLDEGMEASEYVGIIEDALALDKAVAIARGFGDLEQPGATKLHATSVSSRKVRFAKYASEEYKRFSSFFSQRFSDSIDDDEAPSNETSPLLPTAAPSLAATTGASPSYIDLWPIQMAQTGLARSAYTFDSYTLVLQLGTILHMVPKWKEHCVLRTVVFVENEEDAEEESRRVDVLLKGLRIKSELKMVWLKPKHEPSVSKKYEKILRRLRMRTAAASPSSPPPRDVKETISAANLESKDGNQGSSGDEDDYSGLRRRPENGDTVQRPSSLMTTRLSREYVLGFDVAASNPEQISAAFSSSSSSLDSDTPSASTSPTTATQPTQIFDTLPTGIQHEILNELLHVHSGADTTRVLMMTLPAPTAGTAQSAVRAAQYLDELDVLTRGLGSVLMLHGKGLTVTMNL
ncbi:hypothetical protein HDU88_003574 [Geranomyces variabilis]|nr:hypothetical protein HDU88_003574 [Geranomyces variabilis]